MSKWPYSGAITLLLTAHTLADDRPDYSYLDWLYRDQLSSTQANALKSYCSGMYIQDLPASSSDRLLSGDQFYVKADEGELIEGISANFRGNVWIQQQGRNLFGESAFYSFPDKSINLTGGVRFRGSGIVVKGHHIEYSNSAGYGTILNSEFSIPGKHLRGYAESLTLNEEGTADLKSGEITFCEPGKEDWSIAASSININQNTGRGQAWNARLEVVDVPVIYLPYYQFPIDNRRMTGFLNPSLSFATGKNDSVYIDELSTPFYWNIAPNYDDTITPSYYREHGWLLENEFRYLNLAGEGTLRFSRLEKDKALKERRWYQQWQHHKPLGPAYVEWDYTEVSDDDYPSDFRLQDVNDSQQLDQRIQTGYTNEHVKLQAKTHSYQFLNPLVEPGDLPHRRLPEILGEFNLPIEDSGFKLTSETLATRFVRGDFERHKLMGKTDPKSKVDVLDANRLGINIALEYRSDWIWGYGLTRATAKGRHYRFDHYDDEYLNKRNFKKESDFATMTIEAEGGLYFDRFITTNSGSDTTDEYYTQTLEPKLYAASTSYQDQSRIPLFDTSLAPSSYNQLFSPNEFVGWDRIGDSQKAALGVSTRLFSPDGSQIIRASIGQAYYFDRNQILLDPEYRTQKQIDNSDLAQEQQEEQESQKGIPRSLSLRDFKTSPIISEIQWQISDNWQLLNTLEYDPNVERIRQRRKAREKAGAATNRTAGLYGMDGWNRAELLLGYKDEQDRIFNIGIEHTETISNSLNDERKALGTTNQQVNLSAFWPLNDWYALYGQYRIDITNWHEKDPNRPGQNDALSPDSFSDNQDYDVIESLAGVEYQNCCWRMQLSYLESTNVDRTKDYGFLFQIHLKGLGILGKNSDEELSSRIRSYDKRVIHDY